MVLATGIEGYHEIFSYIDLETELSLPATSAQIWGNCIWSFFLNHRNSIDETIYGLYIIKIRLGLVFVITNICVKLANVHGKWILDNKRAQ